MTGGVRPKASHDVFLNIPYDALFLDLFLAYIAGLCALNLTPRATLEIPGGERRLDRIFSLIRSCNSSIHDLSRVELNLQRPPTPRFNMPFELGLTVSLAKVEPARYTWFVFETKLRRAEKSLSDLNGTDVYIHGGRPTGVFQQLGNAFVSKGKKPGVRQMQSVYRKLKHTLPGIMKNMGARSVFEATVFTELRVLGQALTRQEALLERLRA